MFLFQMSRVSLVHCGDLEYHAVAVMHQDAAVGFVELLFLSDFQNKNTREIKSKVNTKRTTNTIELL